MECLVHSNDFHMMTDPIGGKVNPTAVPAYFDLLFDHFFTINLELHLFLDYSIGGIFIVSMIFFEGHLKKPFRLIKF